MPPNLKRVSTGYLFRKVIPKSLRAVLGKSEIKVRCGKSYAEALANYHIESVKAGQLIDDARAKLLESDAEFAAARGRYFSPETYLKPITSVTSDLVDQLRALWLSGLEHDLKMRAQGLSNEEFDELSSNIAEMQSVLGRASARGQIEVILPSLHQLLFVRGYVLALRPEEERELAYAFLDAVMEGYEILRARHDGRRAPVPEIHGVLHEFKPSVARGSTALETEHEHRVTLGTVVEAFLDGYRKKQKGKSMLKKHEVALPLLSEMLGPKLPIENLRQIQLNGYFAQIQKLPSRWPDICRREKITVLELLKNDQLLGTTGMSPKTFIDGYRASISSFLRAARRDYQDFGFPTTLTTEGIEYSGTRVEGEMAQRAMRASELTRLFEGGAMREIAADPTRAHQYWLPVLGLFTGARINELCQLNPLVDIHSDAESGVLYFRITDETPAAENVIKTTKNKVSKRNVPVHPTLLALGFGSYVSALKGAGAKLLFPGFLPQKGRASPSAEKWFRQLIIELGLRDETPGARLVGFHSFRSTLLATAQELEIDLTTVTGHTGTLIADLSGDSSSLKKSADPIVRKYQGEMSVSRKLQRLQRLNYPVTFIKPVQPSVESVIHQVVIS